MENVKGKLSSEHFLAFRHKNMISAAGKDPEITSVSKDFSALEDPSVIKGAGIGTGLLMGYGVTGAETYIHESAHKAAVEYLYKNPDVTIQVDTIDNIKNFIREPSGENLKRVLTLYDANQDGADGVTEYNYGEGLSDAGSKFSESTRRAIVSAAGSLTTLIPDLIGFSAGFKLRKKAPVLGYSLMTLSGFHHAANSMYPLSAVMPGPKEAGHDWASFAKATGIHPAVTGALSALTLPALAAGMYIWERRSEEKTKDLAALSNLIYDGRIAREALDNAFSSYSGKDRIEALEMEMEKLAGNDKCPVTLQEKKKFRAMEKKLSKEYRAFSEALMEKFSDKIREQRRKTESQRSFSHGKIVLDALDSLRKAYVEDKAGTVLTGAGMAGSIVLAAKSGFDALSMAAPGTMAGVSGARVLGSLVPCIGAVMALGAFYRAGKAIKDRNVPVIDKVALTGIAASTGLMAAGAAIPAAGAHLSLIGLAGMGASLAGRWIAHKVAHKTESHK